MKRRSVSFGKSQLVGCQDVKYRTLLNDFLELQKECVGRKKKLQAANQRKQILLAEVRFLRRRYNDLVQVPHCNMEDTIHRPNFDLQSNDALEGEKHQAMTERLDQVGVQQTFTNNEGGKKRDFEELRIENTLSNSSLHSKRMGKRKIIRPSQVTVKSNSVAFGQ